MPLLVLVYLDKNRSRTAALASSSGSRRVPPVPYGSLVAARSFTPEPSACHERCLHSPRHDSHPGAVT